MTMKDSCLSADPAHAQVISSFDDFGSHLECVEDLIAKLTQRPVEDATADMEPEEIATFYANLAYALSALWFGKPTTNLCFNVGVADESSARIRCSDVSPQSHAVMKELQRVSDYFRKIKKTTEKDVPEQGPSMRVDTAAAGRFIRHALSANSTQNVTAHIRMVFIAKRLYLVSEHFS